MLNSFKIASIADVKDQKGQYLFVFVLGHTIELKDQQTASMSLEKSSISSISKITVPTEKTRTYQQSLLNEARDRDLETRSMFPGKRAEQPIMKKPYKKTKTINNMNPFESGFIDPDGLNRSNSPSCGSDSENMTEIVKSERLLTEREFEWYSLLD